MFSYAPLAMMTFVFSYFAWNFLISRAPYPFLYLFLGLPGSHNCPLFIAHCCQNRKKSQSTDLFSIFWPTQLMSFGIMHLFDNSTFSRVLTFTIVL